MLHEVPNPKPPTQDPPPATEGDAGDKTTMETVDKHEGKSVALRTVPIILKNGNKRLLVNCFLDEGSDTTYVNEDVIEQLGLQEEKEPVTVQVANAQQVTFMSATVEIGIESVDGKVDSVIVAQDISKDLWKNEAYQLGEDKRQMGSHERNPISKTCSNPYH